MNLCEVRITRKAFDGVTVLSEIDLSVAPGSFTALVGPSGAGKSTLLNVVSGLDSDYQGDLCWAADDRRRVGYLFQEPRLMPWLSARRNIELVMPEPDAAVARIDQLLQRVGLTGRGDALPGELSGGMQRRVALARAMAIEPDLLLLDEPFSSLDEPTADGLRRLLIALCREQGNAVLLVTHNLREALSLADRVLFLSRDPATIVHREELADTPRDDGQLRDPAGLLQDLLARHPGILSGIVQSGDRG
ncbi:MAG: ABC transporter ATP-binding protein [Gammaproteobacteria bacterium]|nr:ABC transporter ATP-binding protein [Gammaproteobacteria bacterium]